MRKIAISLATAALVPAVLVLTKPVWAEDKVGAGLVEGVPPVTLLSRGFYAHGAGFVYTIPARSMQDCIEAADTIGRTDKETRFDSAICMDNYNRSASRKITKRHSESLTLE